MIRTKGKKCSDSQKTDKHDEKQNKGEENVYD